MSLVRKTLALATVLGLAAGTAQAQSISDLTLDLRGGIGIPTGEVDDVGFEPGFGIRLGVGYQLLPNLGIYAAADHFGANLDRPHNGRYHSTDTGYALGIRYDLAEVMDATPWLSAAGVYDKPELSASRHLDAETEGDYTFGFEVGAGLALPVGGRFAFTPGVRYRWVAPELDGFGEADFSRVAIELGLSTVLTDGRWSALRR